MTAIIAIKHPDPIFEGQTKTKLGSQDASKAVINVTGEQLELYFDKHVEVLKSIIGCAEKSAKIRKAEEKAKSNLLTKQKYSLMEMESLQTVRVRTAVFVRFYRRGRFSRRFGKDCQRQTLSGDSSNQRKNLKCRKGIY